jgi:hypothetical protein
VLSEHGFPPNGIDYIEFFKTDEGFAQEWRRYRLVQRFGVYEIWRRQPD